MKTEFSDLIGKEYPPFKVDVEKGRVGSFAKAIGAKDPVHFDEKEAKANGYRGIIAPLTFGYTIAMDAGQSFNALDEMNVDKTRAVHGEQGFTYHDDICVGDTISGQQEITDIYDKKDGALIFVETAIKLRNQFGKDVVDLHSVIVIRNG